jgi:hypothetical protein
MQKTKKHKVSSISIETSPYKSTRLDKLHYFWLLVFATIITNCNTKCQQSH